MATKDFFWAPLAPGSQIHVGHALGVLAEVAYTERVPPLEAWAEIFDLPRYGVIFTPDAVCPNLMYVGDATRLIIAVPGTTSIMQMWNNILYSAQRTNADYGTGRMHSFFLWCAESIISALGTAVNLWPAGSELCFIGHSLGGAVAQLLADWAEKNTSYRVKLCVTFNSPRVGDPEWARRSRTFPTHLYYGTRDMVCETPLPFTPSASGWQTELGFLDGYEHRDTLIEIESGFSILPSWIAITEAKAAEGTRFAVQEVAGKGIGSRFMHWLGRSAGAAGIVSWVQPLPAWTWSHFMRNLLDGFEEMRSFRRNEEFQALFNLRAALDADPKTGFTNGVRIRGIVPPSHFTTELTIPNPGISGLPHAPHGTRSEVLEAAFEEDGSPEFFGADRLTSTGADFANGLYRQAAASGTTPLAAAAPVQAGPGARPNWLFNGKDRRLLEKLWNVMNAIDARDYQAAFGSPTAALSTRDLIIDEDTQDAWDELRFHLGSVLSLYYAPKQ